MKTLSMMLTSATLATSIALSGCSTTGNDRPTTAADLMRSHADDQQAQVERKNEIAKDWDNAQKMVSEGKKDIEQGNAKVSSARKQLEEGNELIEQGNRKVTEGTERTRDAEQRFSASYPAVEIDPQQDPNAQ